MYAAAPHYRCARWAASQRLISDNLVVVVSGNTCRCYPQRMRKYLKSDRKLPGICGSYCSLVRTAARFLATRTAGFTPPVQGVIKRGNQSRFCTGISRAESILMTGIFPRSSQSSGLVGAGPRRCGSGERVPPLRALFTRHLRRERNGCWLCVQRHQPGISLSSDLTAPSLCTSLRASPIAGRAASSWRDRRSRRSRGPSPRSRRRSGHQ